MLLENGQTGRAYKLQPLADLQDTPDGLMDTQFDYVVGDQCLLGQHDRETGDLFRARTLWGTNGEHLKHDLGQLCDGTRHGTYHQQVMGSNSFGLRSVQKAIWPEGMCKKILKSILKEYDALSLIHI